jgi:hypothetical protein
LRERHVIDGSEETYLRQWLDECTPGIQATYSESIHALKRNALIHSFSPEMLKIFECTSSLAAGAWLAASPVREKVENGAFQQAVAARLLLPISRPDMQTPQACPRCSEDITGDPLTLHALVCDEGKKVWNFRHTALKFAVMDVMRDAGVSAKAEVAVAPNPYNLKPGAGTTSVRADIVQYSHAGQIAAVVETTVVSTAFNGTSASAELREKEKEKKKQYTDRCEIPAQLVNVFAINALGRLGDGATAYLEKLAAGVGDRDSMPWKAFLRRSIQHISVVAAKFLGAIRLLYRDCIRRALIQGATATSM